MDTNQLVAIAVGALFIILLLYGLYRRGQKKEKESIVPEPKPMAAVIETPKAEPVRPTAEETKPPGPVIEIPKVEPTKAMAAEPEPTGTITARAEPVEPLAFEAKPPSTMIETLKPEPVKALAVETKQPSTMIEAPKAESVKAIVAEAKPPSPIVEMPRAEPIQVPSEEVKTEPSQEPAKETRVRGSKIVDIEGIGPVHAEKLSSINIHTASELLDAGATPNGRKELAEKTGISNKLILEWVNMADLLRIKGVGEEYSDLLEEAGVDTVVELARRVPKNLHAKILKINEEKKLVRRPPSLDNVKQWVEEAKKLPRKIQY